MLTSRRLRACAVVSVGLAPLWALAHSSTDARAAAAATFGEPVVSGIQGWGFEQDLRVDSSGPQDIFYTSAPDSGPSASSFLWRSLDGGQTFKWVPAATKPMGKLPTCVGGGDTELATDSAGHLYFNDLTLANFSTARSDDRGGNFALESCSGVPDVGVDRPWYATIGDPTNGGSIVLAYDRVAQTLPVGCPNGGTANPNNNFLVLAMSPTVPAGGATAGVQFGASQAVSCDEQIMGNVEIFDYGANGAKKAFVVHDSADLTKVYMARCDLVGFLSLTNPTGTLTGFSNCIDQQIDSFPGSITGANFATMAVDGAGALYAVWERAPFDATGHTAAGGGKVTGDVALWWSKSTDQGVHWATPQTLPTPGLANNVFAWTTGGDSGMVDIAWYGTPQTCDATCVAGGGGADLLTTAHWGLYFMQTLDGGGTWSTPVLASHHEMHRGTIQTLMGLFVAPPQLDLSNRMLGDFLQMRLDRNGGAVISYADSNNQVPTLTTQAMIVRQNAGPSLRQATPTISGPAIAVGSVTLDGQHQARATFDTGSVSTAQLVNLTLQSSAAQLGPGDLVVTMQIADLRSLAPQVQSLGPDLVWLTQWHVVSDQDPNGGKVYFVYMESVNGGAPSCFAGEMAVLTDSATILNTYPGVTQLGTGPDTGSCSYTPTAPGTITIDIPLSLCAANLASNFCVTDPGADPTLYSVTSATMSLTQQANTVAPFGGIGGVPFNLIDVSPPYEVMPGTVVAPEAPWLPLLVATGIAALLTTRVWSRARRRRADQASPAR